MSLKVQTFPGRGSQDLLSDTLGLPIYNVKLVFADRLATSSSIIIETLQQVFDRAIKELVTEKYKETLQKMVNYDVKGVLEYLNRFAMNYFFETDAKDYFEKLKKEFIRVIDMNVLNHFDENNVSQMLQDFDNQGYVKSIELHKRIVSISAKLREILNEDAQKFYPEIKILADSAIGKELQRIGTRSSNL